MKYALVTGASRGLGRGFVEHLLSEGYFVFACMRNPLENSDNPSLIYIDLDVTNDESLSNAYEKVLEHTDTLDILINNAGVNKRSATNNRPELVSSLASLDRSKLANMFNVNTISPLIITKKFYSLMKNDPSFIVNISSCRASFHDPYESKNANYGYRASKIALNMLVHDLIKELPQNTKVFAVHPGDVHTDMNPKGTDEPREQASKIIAITQNWKEEFNGKFLNYDGEYFPF